MSFPLVLPGTGGSGAGDYWGSGPGFDIGDLYGPNSALCRSFGIGCGGGGGEAPSLPPWQPPTNGGPMQYAGGGCPTSPFRAGAAMAARAVPFVVPNPVSGRPVWFMPAGAPVLWSGDLRACKRVSRIAARAARSGGRKRMTYRRRRRGG